MMASTTTNAMELLAASAPLLKRLANLWWNPATADSVADLAQEIAEAEHALQLWRRGAHGRTIT